MWSLVDVAELLLAIVVYAWVGKRPTVAKTSGAIVAFWALEFGSLAVTASGEGTDLYTYSLGMLDASLKTLGTGANASQLAVFQDAVATVAGCAPALYAISASAVVFGLLCLRWAVDRMRHKSLWTAFSRLDLSFWWVVPLIVGIAVYVVSMLPGVPDQNLVFLVALNLVMVSAIPLFVQGAAVGKGLMNRFGIGLAWQLVLGLFGIVSSVVFVVLPLIGLVDIWANFRRLPRDGQRPTQKRLPE